MIDGKFQDYKVERRPVPVPGEDAEIEHQFLYQQANSGWVLCGVSLSHDGAEMIYYFGS